MVFAIGRENEEGGAASKRKNLPGVRLQIADVSGHDQIGAKLGLPRGYEIAHNGIEEGNERSNDAR